MPRQRQTSEFISSVAIPVACAVCIGKGPAKQKINACSVFVFTYLHATVHSIHVSKEEEEADGELEGQNG